MCRSFPLAFRAHREQPLRFLDHDDGVIQVNDFEAVAAQCCVRRWLSNRNGHDVARIQLRIVPEPSLVSYRNGLEAEKFLGLFARQPERQADEIRQELASGCNAKMMVLSHCEPLAVEFVGVDSARAIIIRIVPIPHAGRG